MQSQLLVSLGGIIGGFFGLVFTLAYFAFFAAIIYGGWKTFEKAGKPGWGMLIPIYNLVLLHEIVGRETIKLLLWFIPLVNIYFIITLYVSLGKSFGKSTTGELVLSVLFWPLYLGLGSARYVGPVENGGGMTTANTTNPFGTTNS